MSFVGVQAPPPTWRHLRHWEQVCCFLDSQPRRAVAHPLPLDPPMSARLLKRMAAQKLVRHYDDCTWRLDRRWRSRLLRLAQGLPPDEPRERGQQMEADTTPFIADTGVDTLYVSLFGEQVPAVLIAACGYYKEAAQEDDTSSETDWRFYDAPLSMWKHGVGTSKGNKVSWSFLLRNEYLQFLLRRSPLSGMFGSVRFSAQCLWTFGAKEALDRFYSDLDDLWVAMEAGGASAIRFQVSQIHLCVDIANFAPVPADLARIVSRSVKKAVHIPSLADEGVPDPSVYADSDEFDLTDPMTYLQEEPWEMAVVPPEWAGVPLDFFTDTDTDADDDENKENNDTLPDEESAVDEEGASAYLWGQRASGFSFSPGADLSAAWYDKALEERLSGKTWMRPMHEAGGWRVGMPLFRIEARFRRGVLRELASAYGQDADTVERWFDDPWQCLNHLNDLLAYYAGLPPEHDTVPDVLGQSWMRLTLPNPEDSNRSRWPTDPIWELLQRATFNPDPPTALKRLPKVAHDLTQVDAELYGLLKLRTVLRGEYLNTTTTLSLELRRFAEHMEEVDAEKGRDFAEEVREKARLLGKPVPLRTQDIVVASRFRSLTLSEN